jgi:nucleoid-associated protein YgaU
MQRDLKIGMLLGLIVVAVTTVWLSTRPGLSTRARLRQIENTMTAPPDPVESLMAVQQVSQPSRVKKSVDLTVYEQSEKIKTERFHIVRDGQSLSSISKIYYGSAGKWSRILKANQKTIKNPNKLIPGAKLIIPE